MKTKSFILVAVGVFAVLVGGFVYVALGGGSDERRLGAEVRSYTAGKWVLEVSGVQAGFLKGVGGCGVTAEVRQITETDKGSGAPKPDACVLHFGTGMASSVYSWISAAAGGTAPRKNIVLHQTDIDGKSKLEVRLFAAAITRFSTPTLNASSLDSVLFELELSPDRLESVKGSGAAVGGGLTPQKLLLARSYRVTVDGLPTPRVSSVGEWSFEVTPPPVGVKAPARPRFANLTLVQSEADAEPWAAWADALVKGNPTERGGSLELLNSAGDQTLVKIGLSNLGLVAADLYGASEVGSNVVTRQYSMYVEDARVDFMPAAS